MPRGSPSVKTCLMWCWRCDVYQGVLADETAAAAARRLGVTLRRAAPRPSLDAWSQLLRV